MSDSCKECGNIPRHCKCPLPKDFKFNPAALGLNQKNYKAEFDAANAEISSIRDQLIAQCKISNELLDEKATANALLDECLSVLKRRQHGDKFFDEDIGEMINKLKQARGEG